MDKYGIRSKVIIQLITSASLKLYNIFIYFVRGKVEIVGRTSKQKLWEKKERKVLFVYLHKLFKTLLINLSFTKEPQISRTICQI